MKVSLVLATIGRTSEVTRFLIALSAQTYRTFELIVVDQNPDDRLVAVLEPYTTRFRVKHIRSKPGLSRARNIGLYGITGDIVCFPDDDCWYRPDLLLVVTDQFARHPDWHGITGRSEDGRGQTSAGKFARTPAVLTRTNVWSRGISYSIFLRTSVVNNVGAFDETLGVGSSTPFGAGEETDYLIRAIDLNYIIQYQPDLVIFHPNKVGTFERQTWPRARSYGRGMGRVMRKQSIALPFVIRSLIRPVGGMLLAVAAGQASKSRYHWNVFVGRLQGYIAPAHS